MIQAILDQLKANGYSKSTLEYYKPILEEANDFKPLQDWTKKDIIAFVLHLQTKNKESSVETKKGVLKTFFKLTGKEEIAEDISIRIVKNNLRREDILTVEDVNKLIDSTDSPMYKALIAFLFESGARINEALSVKIKNVQDLPDQGLIIGITDTKTNNNIRESAYIYSAQYIRNHITYSGLTKDDKLFPISDQAVQKMLNKLRERAGIKKPVTPHKFRHAQATDMLTRQYSELIIRKQLGWSSDSRMLSRYIHLVDQDVIDARLEKSGLNTINKKISNIKIAEPLKIAEASLQLRKLNEENEYLKKEIQTTKESSSDTYLQVNKLRVEVIEMQRTMSIITFISNCLLTGKLKPEDLESYIDGIEIPETCKISIKHQFRGLFRGTNIGKIEIPENQTEYLKKHYKELIPETDNQS